MAKSKKQPNNLEINGESFRYVGKPLDAFVLISGYWSGRSNLLPNNLADRKIALKNLEDCFKWIKHWLGFRDCDGAYVLDYSTKTVYYDTQETLDDLLQETIPKQGKENFFEHFVQKDFSE